MNQQQNRLNVLLKQYANDALSIREQEELSALLQQHWDQPEEDQPAVQLDWEKMMQGIVADGSTRPVRRIQFRRNDILRYAAVILFVIGSGAYIYFNIGQKSDPMASAIQPVARQTDVLPGSDKAILTLSNGRKVELNAKTQQTITDGSLAINNYNGNLIYNKTDVAVQNTMTTPKGGQYKLSLPDGSRVWLNAASSITFPTSFPGSKREVSITGEAYFEVAKNPKQPFIVKTPTDEITVLGTHLNINSYADEPSAKISLSEGSIKVGQKILKPGDAYFEGKVSKTNLDLDLAWKHGVFSFDKTRIDAVMRQLSRWYNIEVHYPDGIPELIISGSMGRDLTLSQTLVGLKALGTNAQLQDNILVVKH